jgi:hypothetical protein
MWRQLTLMSREADWTLSAALRRLAGWLMFLLLGIAIWAIVVGAGVAMARAVSMLPRLVAGDLAARVQISIATTAPLRGRPPMGTYRAAFSDANLRLPVDDTRRKSEGTLR